MEQNGEIILYQPDATMQLEVRLENESVWLTQAQMATLFGTQRQAVTKHIKNIYDSGELEREATCSILELVRMEGNRLVNRRIEYYNLDTIISVGYRVNTKRGILFRQWANRVLKDYLLKGYAINQRLERIENRIEIQQSLLNEHSDKIEFFIHTAMPPLEGIFFDGQVFDAHCFASDLVRSAKQRIILIDNYIDDTVLKLLDKRDDNVEATIYTRQISQTLQNDINLHNSQYRSISVQTFSNSHDRFLLIDDTVYHIGASLKDLGKKWFAFSKMGIDAEWILGKL